MLKRILLSLLVLTSCTLYSYGQVAIKTNLALDAFRIPNLGLEVGLGKKITLEASVYYNPWKFSENKQLKLFMAQPEVRYWICDKFNGHFFGLHLHGGIYNTTGIQTPLSFWRDTKDYRYEGNFYGAGISYGYQFILGRHWNLEATIGAGYARINYRKYSCQGCGEKIGESAKNYFGPTKLAVSIIYIF